MKGIGRINRSSLGQIEGGGGSTVIAGLGAFLILDSVGSMAFSADQTTFSTVVRVVRGMGGIFLVALSV